jgi:Arc/MetJ-type ribon-helix-helix transcriptional regulator
MSQESERKNSVELPSQIIDRVEARLPRTEFESEAEYITFVLEEILYRVEEETEDDDYEEVDEDEVKDRLESLGYLDK